MKLILPALGLLLSAPALGQVPPTKGATAILVHTPDSANVAYKKVAQALLAQGYGLAKTDKELGFISTEPRPAPRYNMLYSCKFAIRATPTGSDVQVSGTFTLPGAAAVASFMAGESTITYRGGAASTTMICWQAMQQAALGPYPAASVTYLTLP